MTAHSVRAKRPANGYQQPHKGKGGKLVRIMASVEPEDFALLQELAAKRKQPIAKVLRTAVWAYLWPLRGRRP